MAPRCDLIYFFLPLRLHSEQSVAHCMTMTTTIESLHARAAVLRTATDESSQLELFEVEASLSELGETEEKMDEKLKRAAAKINATELTDGEYAHYDDGMRRWYVVTAADLASLCDYLDSTDESVRNDAYSHWCAGTTSREMPEGWTPAKMGRYHVLTESAAIELGIIDAETWNQLHYSADESAVAAAAESSHADRMGARNAAKATGLDRWVIDLEGNSSWIRRTAP